MRRIEAKPKHLFSWGYDLYVDSQHLTTMDMRWMREGGSFHWKGIDYTLGRESCWSGDFYLKEKLHILARAQKISPFSHQFNIQTEAYHLKLKRTHLFTRAFQILEGDKVVGDINPSHLFTRSCSMLVTKDIDIPEQIFIFWLVILMWRRMAQSD